MFLGCVGCSPPVLQEALAMTPALSWGSSARNSAGRAFIKITDKKKVRNNREINRLKQLTNVNDILDYFFVFIAVSS